MLKQFLISTLGKLNWSRSVVTAVAVKDRPEMPRFPVRFAQIVFGALVTLGCLIAFFLLGSPAAKVRDPRLTTQYNASPLTCLAASHGKTDLWLGTEGNGITVLDAPGHLFRSDLTYASTGGKLLSDYIVDLDFGPRSSKIAAVVLSDGRNGPGGVQICSSAYPPVFWTNAVIDLTSFPGLDDTNASCVIESADQKRLVIGTRGFGLGIYHISRHSWTDRVTAKDGLPSDTINDLASVSSGDSKGVVWVATDKGLCAGPLNEQGRFERKWTYEADSGLAGESIRRLLLRGSHLWYLTDGHGLGRLAIDAHGAPADDVAHELLVTERRLPGLNDRSLRLAKGSPAGPTTWFLAEIDGKNFVGHYREKPHDTFGKLLPDRLSLASVTSLATHLESGRELFIGTDRGGCFFRDVPRSVKAADQKRNASGPSPSRSVSEPLEDIDGDFAGPANIRIDEAVLGGPLAIIKNKAPSGVSVLQKAPVADALPWQWSVLVGPGRFTELTSSDDLSCVAGASNRTYFGTKGKGIGVWDRQSMEVRLEMHATSSDAAVKLRHNTSLDLAMAGQTLIQVTGDKAVDTFLGGQRTALVPPDEAPVAPGEVVTATAKGRIFACAGSDKIGIYDLDTFGWTEMPSLSGVTRLEVTSGMLWALTASGQLHAVPLGALRREWTLVTEQVKDLASSLETMCVLVQVGGHPAEVHAYNGDTGGETFKLTPKQLDSQKTNWRFAAVNGGDIFLAGDDRALHRYKINAREWHRIPFPESFTPPIAQAVRTGNAFWLVDSARVLHRFKFDLDDNQFQADLEQHVERLAGFENAVVVLLDAAQGQRVVWRSDKGEERRVIVGRPFEGNLTQVSDAVEWQDKLVVAQGEQLGFYDWSTHDWTTVKTSLGVVTRLYTAADALWAWRGAAGRATLQAWWNNSFKPVQDGVSDLALSKISTDKTGLFVLDVQGRVLWVSSAKPTAAEELIAATRLNGGPPDKPALSALLQGTLVTCNAQGLHSYGSFSGVTRWLPSEFHEQITRIINDPNGSRLVAQSESKAWVITADSNGHLTTREINARSANLGVGLTVTGIAAGSGESACAVQVKDETGNRVWSMPAGSSAVKELVGPPLPVGRGTRAVVSSAGSGHLIRLDAAGSVAVYSPRDRAWSVELRDNSLDALWPIAESVAGYSKQKKSLLVRTGAGWRIDSESQGQVEKVFAFPEGLALALTGGELVWRPPNTAMRLVRPAPNPQNAPGTLGTIVTAVEADGLLAVLGENGRLAIFDWPKQAWLKFGGTRVHALGRLASEIYLLVDTNNVRQLAGPLQRAGATAIAPLITSPQSIKNLSVSSDAMFCVAEDRAIYRLTEGTLRKWWGGGTDGVQTGTPALLAAERIDNQAWLLTQSAAGQAALMKVDLRTLESQTQVLPPGRVETVFRTNDNDLFALLATANGKYPLNLVTMQPVAPPSPDLQEVAVVDSSIWGITANGVFLATDGQWQPLQEAPEPVSQEFLNLIRPSLAQHKGSILMTNSASGAWQSGGEAGWSVDVFVGANERRSKLVPTRDRLALAHEFVNEITTSKAGLFAATEGGVVEFKFEAGSSQAEVLRIHDDTDGLPKIKIKTIEQLAQLSCVAEDGRWFELTDGRWRMRPTPDAAQLMQTRRTMAKGNLSNWEFSEDATGTNALRRRFPNQEWRTVRLLSTGFNFEQIAAVEVVADRFQLYTPAGTLIYSPDSAGIEPNDLLPKWHSPATITDGVVLRGAKNESFLSPSGDLSKVAGEQIWVHDASQWRIATALEKQTLVAMSSAPFLDNSRWKWERPTVGSTSETVTWKISGGTPLSSVFSPSSGRFGWDTCLALGQAQGQTWMLTSVGLFRITDDQIDNTSLFVPPTPLSKVSFLEVCGDLPGALVTEAKETVVGFENGWKQRNALSRETLVSLEQFRAVGKTWKLKRDGTFLRSLPQSPDHFEPVQLLADGRWNFETISDLATLEGTCYLATEAGPAATRNTALGLVGLWTGTGKPAAVDVINQKAVAKLAEGRNIEFDGSQWHLSSYQGPLHSAVETNNGPHFKLTRKLPAVTFEVKRNAVAAFQPVKSSAKGFAFDQVHDANLKDESTAFASTEEGLIELAANGDFTNVPLAGLGNSERLEFFRVPDEADSSSLFARSSGEQFLKHEKGWQRISAAAGSQAQILSQTRLASSGYWRVTVKPGLGVELRLHLDADPTGVYKLVNFGKVSGLLGFDDFFSIATPDVEGRLVLGAREGLQRINQQGRLQRMWCQKDNEGSTLDGIGPVPVSHVARDESGVVQLQAEGQFLQVDKASESVVASAKARFEEALALKSAEPDGWRVELNRSANIPMRVKWRGQPVFLTAGDKGKARFAHNVVHAALVVDGRLMLATEGGLVLLNSEQEKDRATIQIVSKPFLESSERTFGQLPLAFGWLALEPGGRTIYAQPMGARSRGWHIPLSRPENATMAQPAELDTVGTLIVSQDDVLLWRHPKAGRVEIRFAPGKSTPENLEPQIADGTFTFLNLDISGADNPPATLLQTSSGTFWITRGGLDQFDPEAGEFLHLFAETTMPAQPLKAVSALHWSLTNRVLYARQSKAVFEFDALNRRWARCTSSLDPFLNKDLINASPMLEWRQSDRSVHLTFKANDCDTLEFFDNGKPGLDEVNDLAFASDQPQEDVLLATRTGVADFEAPTFGYLRLHAAAFGEECKDVQPVEEIAAVQMPDSIWRKCARAQGGRSYESVDGQWKARSNVEEVFELSYRRVTQEGQWDWSRYASGLSCTMHNVNGPAFRLGRAVNGKRAGIFSRGKMAIDDAQGVALRTNELLVLTPVGLVRLKLDTDTQVSRYAGLEVWSMSSAPGRLLPMTNLLGLLRDNGLTAWNSEHVFLNPGPDLQMWKLSPAKPLDVAMTRRITDDKDVWLVQPDASMTEIAIAYSGSLLGSWWYVPTQTAEIQDTGVSDDGFWFLTRNELFHVDRARVKRNLRHVLFGRTGVLPEGVAPPNAKLIKPKREVNVVPPPPANRATNKPHPVASATDSVPRAVSSVATAMPLRSGDSTGQEIQTSEVEPSQPAQASVHRRPRLATPELPRGGSGEESEKPLPPSKPGKAMRASQSVQRILLQVRRWLGIGENDFVSKKNNAGDEGEISMVAEFLPVRGIGQRRPPEKVCPSYAENRQAVMRESAEIRRDAIEPVFQAVSRTDWNTRSAAVQVIENIDDTRFVDTFAARLNDIYLNARHDAAAALGKMKNERAVAPLAEMLKECHSFLREAAPKALGEIGNVGGAEPLLKALCDSESDVRWETATALGKIGSDRTKPIRSLESCRSAMIQRVGGAAAEVLETNWECH